ncbi:MAG: zf-TFIIB domain-containing protein [Nitrospirae bacterium]|nr:zf-TFIIB domain-containing protein [Nitrospirota bacterium]
MTENKTKCCAHCGKNINVKYSTCPLCGGQNGEDIKPAPPVCPRCRVDLRLIAKDGEEYDLCTQCGGLWLDKGEFHRSTSESDVYRKENFKDEYQKGPAIDTVEYVPCVRCGKLMNRKNFGQISGVIIDECRKHGVWLDGGELEKIRHFIADGGLEKVQDLKIEENRAELRDLATRVADVDFTQRVIHFWDWKRWLFRGW